MSQKAVLPSITLLDRWLKDGRPGYRTLSSPDRRFTISLSDHGKIILQTHAGHHTGGLLQTCESLQDIVAWIKTQREDIPAFQKFHKDS